MKSVFQANRGVYGSLRVHAELRDRGIKCARKRVARLTHEQELFAKHPRHRTVTTHSDPEAQAVPNLL
ncbi:MAG: transposase [Ktedonobacteraceae bacterium]|nr:transposase [Ktedonobacteraceae bacterium]MBO0793117.1 transposase [Ktedonobacteraceae bacterium]